MLTSDALETQNGVRYKNECIKHYNVTEIIANSSTLKLALSEKKNSRRI